MFELTLVMGKLNISMAFGDSGAGVATATATVGRQDMPQVALLAMQVQQVYTLGELRIASRLLGVEFENLAGDMLFDKAYGLVDYFQRRGAMVCLVSYLESDRPHVDWRSFGGTLA